MQENKIKDLETEPETPSEVTPPVDLAKEYEDAFLSFEYPDNVELLFSQPMGGRSDSQNIEYTVDGRASVQIITGDMSGETFFLVIPSNESGDAYRFSGSYLSEDVTTILDLFVQTAELKQ